MPSGSRVTSTAPSAVRRSSAYIPSRSAGPCPSTASASSRPPTGTSTRPSPVHAPEPTAYTSPLKAKAVSSAGAANGTAADGRLRTRRRHMATAEPASPTTP